MVRFLRMVGFDGERVLLDGRADGRIVWDAIKRRYVFEMAGVPVVRFSAGELRNLSNRCGALTFRRRRLEDRGQIRAQGRG